MKKFILTFVLLSVTLFASTTKNSHYSERLCKVFTKKTKLYQKNMRADEYAQKTLESYEKRSKIYCTK